MSSDYNNLLNSIDTLKEKFENEFSCIEADSDEKVVFTAKGKDDYDLLMTGKRRYDNFYKFVNKSGDECTLFTNDRDNIWSPSIPNDSSFTIFLPNHAIRLTSFAICTPNDERFAQYMPGTMCLYGYNADFNRWDVIYFIRVKPIQIDSGFDLEIVNGTEKNLYRAFSFFTYSEHFALSFFKLYGDLIEQDDELDDSVYSKQPMVSYHNMPVIEEHYGDYGILSKAMKTFGPELDNFVVSVYESGENKRPENLWGAECNSHFKSKLITETRPNVISFYFPNHVIYFEGYQIIGHESPNLHNWCVGITPDANSEGIIVHKMKKVTLKDKGYYNFDIKDLDKKQRFCRIIRFFGLDKEFSFTRIDFFGIAIPAEYQDLKPIQIHKCPYPSIVDSEVVRPTPKPKGDDKKQLTKNEGKSPSKLEKKVVNKNDIKEEKRQKEEEKKLKRETNSKDKNETKEDRKPKQVEKPTRKSSSSSESSRSNDNDNDDDDYVPPKKQQQRSPSKTSNQQQQRPPSTQAQKPKPEPPKEPTKYFCMYCGYSASSISFLTGSSCRNSPNGKHQLYSGDTKGPFYCMYCGYKSSSISSLTSLNCRRSPNEKHIPFESSGMPSFYCKYCGNKSYSISSLTSQQNCRKSPNGKHLPYSGSEKKNYYCKFCGYKSYSISTLTSQQNCRKSPNGYHLPYSGEEKNNYYCKFCGYKSYSISTLTSQQNCRKSPNGYHIPYSGEEKNNYYCKYCGNKSYSISSLTSQQNCRKSPTGYHIPAK